MCTTSVAFLPEAILVDDGHGFDVQQQQPLQTTPQTQKL
jgi:hypothetical protein